MELNVYRQDGSESGRKVTLDADVFGVTPNDHAIWLDVRAIEASGRQGTHKTKERSEVSGGGSKPWRQKGTGRARVGTIRSPLWVGGGRVFGPRPHTYNLKVNRKTKQNARRSALTYKAEGNNIQVIEDFSMDAPKTSTMVEMLAANELAGKKILFLLNEQDMMLYKSGRNIPKLTMMEAGNASTRDLLNAQVLLVQESALASLSGALGSANLNKAEEVSE